MTVRPLKLRPDNFTPPSRTPWGGRYIRGRYKQSLHLSPGEPVVGEAWEVSVEPNFPSRTADDDSPLPAVIASRPDAWLGNRASQTSLLVKFLDAAQNLSVQVHPHDDDKTLAAHESGKPEAWIVLRADPGAGIYLGFKDVVSESDVERCIDEGGALDALMNFVAVEPGDAFVIAAGTAHAIGAGLTLLEPQIVRPGREGVTYRYWDWNRRYDAAGVLSPSGEPRALHAQRSIAVTDWSRPLGNAFVAACRVVPSLISDRHLTWTRVIEWDWFQVDRLQGTGQVEGYVVERFCAVTCVHGTVCIDSQLGTLNLECGESGVLPACSAMVTIEGRDADVFIVHEGATG
ncbi:MAG: class I mannose-6-phosphate isomerase [Chromatiales bacterium]|jgi:mannose-6-phosphate isomerase|nr:class I mannose-6-phosphate isomerase [Chromatiales bacterium]